MPLAILTILSSRHKYKTKVGSSSTFCIPLVRTNYGKFNILFKGAVLWNNNEESLQCPTVRKFKQSLEKAISFFSIFSPVPQFFGDSVCACAFFSFFICLLVSFIVF